MLGRAGIAVTLFDQRRHRPFRTARRDHPSGVARHSRCSRHLCADRAARDRLPHRELLRRQAAARLVRPRAPQGRDPPSLGVCNASRTSCRAPCSNGQGVRAITLRTETNVIECAEATMAASTCWWRRGRQARAAPRKSYLVGADGARSTVRKAIGVEFEGFTYPERFMIIGTPYDFADDGYAYRNYIADPDEWYNLFKISWKGPPGVYRLVAPVRPDEPLDGDSALRRRSASCSASILGRRTMRSSSMIAIPSSNASPRPSAKAACSSPAIALTSTARSAPWA